MPLLWGDRVVGWGTAAPVRDGRLRLQVGFVEPGLARDPALSGAIDREAASLAEFLGLDAAAASWRRVGRPRL